MIHKHYITARMLIPQSNKSVELMLLYSLPDNNLFCEPNFSSERLRYSLNNEFRSFRSSVYTSCFNVASRVNGALKSIISGGCGFHCSGGGLVSKTLSNVPTNMEPLLYILKACQISAKLFSLIVSLMSTSRSPLIEPDQTFASYFCTHFTRRFRARYLLYVAHALTTVILSRYDVGSR
ncbi:hypothetical protein ALC60_11798 [Trachymyrmex zeteki]|uniref:Uncharacterized protein n=1 Tax=Mycetomoellerius zeteki TaxID=64791 RepID=A0A151WMT7_9HYME|nr:hypothetical protein ALC60_11798 [Trachymyrmex zeteki]